MSIFLHCIVTHTRRKWAVAQPPYTWPPFFFHSQFFFLLHFVSSTGRSKNIFFFLVLHTVKPKKKTFLHIFFFSFNSRPFCPNFLKQLVLTLNLVFNIIPMPFTKHTISITAHNNNSCYAYHSHIKHHACSVLILSRDFLGNHIPKL